MKEVGGEPAAMEREGQEARWAKGDSCDETTGQVRGVGVAQAVSDAVTVTLLSHHSKSPKRTADPNVKHGTSPCRMSAGLNALVR